MFGRVGICKYSKEELKIINKDRLKQHIKDLIYKYGIEEIKSIIAELEE